jgi:hypothetical protein
MGERHLMENSRPKLLEPEVMEAILLDRMDRLQELIDDGRFDDAVSIGEEFDEWLTDVMN